MTYTVQDIQVVLGLRKTIREPTVSASIMASIDTIHHSIASSSEQHGWKTVDWRGSRTTVAAPSSNSRSYHSNRSYHSSNRGGDAQSAFNGGRFRNQQAEPSASAVSIPLTATTPATQAAPAPTSSHSSGHSSGHSSKHHWQENADGFRHPHPKYVSKFRKSSDKVEDTILNTILLGKLNKFSLPNYNEIKEFITHIIDSDQTEMIKCFMKLVFEKAASEEVFCPLYAKLLSELSIQYPVLLTEMANLYNQYMEIFDEVEEDTSSETYHELCKRNVEKKYRRGYSQFLAELIKHEVIDTNTFMKSIDKIIRQVETKRNRVDSIKLNEEFADCLMKIMKAIYSEVSSDSDDEEDSERKIDTIRTTIKSEMMLRIEPLTIRHSDASGISNKARFTFLDIYERIQKF